MSDETLYDKIGKDYALGRHTDPRLAAQIHAAIGPFESLLNVGAGTGNYEPMGDKLTAVDPSAAMIAQRSSGTAPAIQASAERLPFPERHFSHAMCVLSMHHWQDRQAAFAELARVVRERLVVVTWDPAEKPFWLTRDYFPEIIAIDRQIFPPIAEFETAFRRVRVAPLPIPADCIDGFTGAFWRRPDAYLLPEVRAKMSTFARIRREREGVAALEADLASGAWREANASLLELPDLDIGYRLVVVELGDS